MVALLGVSKAVLDNVIFCHQEDSNWYGIYCADLVAVLTTLTNLCIIPRQIRIFSW